MAFAKALPTWNKAGVAPNTTKQTEGWQVDENPPADWFNWHWNTTFLALKELQDNAIHKDGSGTFSGQIKSGLATGTAPLVVVSKTLVANLNADMVDGYNAQAATAADTIPVRDANQNINAARFTSTASTGTAPFTVASQTQVANLNASLLAGQASNAGAVANTIASRDANGDLTARQLKSTAAQGTEPFTVVSKTVVANLNAALVNGYTLDQDLQKSTSPTFASMTLSQATGMAPLTVTSTTKVTNLNADMVDDLHAATAATANTIAARDASGDLTARRFVSNIANGTAPFGVTSTTVIPNLNADFVDGFHMDQDVRKAASPTFAGVTLANAAFTALTDTAPFTVSSQTMVANLNAEMLGGKRVGEFITSAGGKIEGLNIERNWEPEISITNTGMDGSPKLLISMNEGNNGAIFQTTGKHEFLFHNGQYALRLGTNGGPVTFHSGDITAGGHKVITAAGGQTINGLSMGSVAGERFHVYANNNIKIGFGVDMSAGGNRELAVFHTSSDHTNGRISFGHRYETNGSYHERMALLGDGTLTRMGTVIPMTRNNGGVYEWQNAAGEWTPIDSGSMVMLPSQNIKIDEPTQRAGQRNQQRLVAKFMPPTTGDVRVMFELQGASNVQARFTIARGGSAGIDWNMPIGYSLTADENKMETLATHQSSTWTPFTVTVSIESKIPHYFVITSNTSLTAIVRDFKLAYDTI